MGHLSVYRRMLVWGIGTLVAIFGVAKTTLVLFSPRVRIEEVNNLLLYVFLFVGGMVIIVINETVFSVRKEQREIDRDETIKSAGEKYPPSPTVLAICPQCKSRVPSNSKYCLECGADLQRQTATPIRSR